MGRLALTLYSPYLVLGVVSVLSWLSPRISNRDRQCTCELVLVGDESIVDDGDWQREVMRVGLLFSDTEAMA